jgi:beta-galactosidase
MTLTNWEVFPLPFDENYVKQVKPSSIDTSRKGTFFKGIFDLSSTGDTFIDMAQFKKGMVWVNGHNLGRY